MRFAAAGLCVALLLAVANPVASAQPPAPASPEANLLAAMRLWGDVRFFDPAVAGDGAPWDAAFVAAEPSILAATTPDAYRAAIASLLAPLHDPATHVDDPSAVATGRISLSTIGSATVITIPHGVTADDATIEADAANAAGIAAGAPAVVFDLRDVSENSAGDAEALDDLFTGDSPIAALVDGNVALPRVRSRAYVGFPNEAGGGFQGYSAQDAVADGPILRGTSKQAHKLAFIVNAGTSLPPMALALAEAGKAAIYTTGGRPAILAPSTSGLQLPYGVGVSYRTADVPGFGRPLALASVTGPQDAVAKLDASGIPKAAFETRAAPPPATGDAYANAALPPEPLRMLAVAKIYNVVRYFSPYTTLMHDDWDAAAVQAIADERTAGDARSYLLGLLRFYAHLHDSHGFVTGELMIAAFGGGVPFEARYLHRRAVVTQLSANAGRSPLKLGDVIDAVDGIPIRRAMDVSERYICSSTLQAADYAALRSSGQPSVFAGRAGTSLNLTFHHLRGKPATITLVRSLYSARPDRRGPKYFVLPGNVGYVDFDRLDPGEVDAMFDALRNTRAIVFDNRGYPRGTAWQIAPRLTTAGNVRAALFDTPLVTQPLDDTRGDAVPLPVYRHFYQLLPAQDGLPYLKPTVMLIDERTISQSEHSALFFRAATHTRFVGTPTRGADGDVTSMLVPGGVALSFSGEGVRHADGAQLQRIGILPDVRVEPAAADIASGNDAVLQAGLDEALALAAATPQSRDAAVRQEAARERAAFASAPALAGLTAKGENAQPLKLAWKINNSAYAARATAGAGYNGTDEIDMTRPSTAKSNATFGSYAGTVDLTAYRGKTVRIRGYLSARNAGGAGFWFRVDGPSVQFDNMQDRWLAGTRDWTPFAIVLHVPPDATNAYAGLLLVGSGTARASALTIDLVPDTTPTTNQ